MSEAQVAAFCLSLPGAGLSFKVADEPFLGYCDRPGVRPAPYLARARRNRMALPYPMGRDELCDLLQRSHQLVVRRLPKRLQAGLMI